MTSGTTIHPAGYRDAWFSLCFSRLGAFCNLLSNYHHLCQLPRAVLGVYWSGAVFPIAVVNINESHLSISFWLTINVLSFQAFKIQFVVLIITDNVAVILASSQLTLY